MNDNLYDLTGQSRTPEEMAASIGGLQNAHPAPHTGSSIGDPMENYAKDYVDQKFETERARTDTAFAVLSGKMDTMSAKIEAQFNAIPSRWEMWLGLLGVVVAIIGTVFTVLSYSGGRFDAGIGLADQRQDQIQRDEAQDARLNEILEAIQALRSTD